MTEHIRRFIDAPDDQTQESFVDLFGSADYKTKTQGMTRRDREDALVTAYADNVRQTGRYQYSCTAIVLHPQIDRTYFHLIYATRNMKGIEVFKKAEEKAMKVMEQKRADLQQKSRQKKTGERELFSSEVRYKSTLYDELRKRYLIKAQRLVQQALQASRRVSYDHAWVSALSLPLVWERDLKNWIDKWAHDGHLRIEGMRRGQRVPMRRKGNFLLWIGPSF